MPVVLTWYQTISYLHKLNMDDGATEMSHNFFFKEQQEVIVFIRNSETSSASEHIIVLRNQTDYSHIQLRSSNHQT